MDAIGMGTAVAHGARILGVLALGAHDLPYLTLGISLAALLLAGISFLWQVVAFWLGGSRVKVSLEVGRREEIGHSVSAPPDRWPADLTEVGLSGGPSRCAVEQAIITVHNPGRVPVTVNPPEMRMGSYGVGNSKPVDDRPEGPARVEPGGFAQWSSDLWPIIRTFRRRMPGKRLALRAAVKVGARRRPKMSPRHSKIYVRPEDETLTYEKRPSEEYFIYNDLLQLVGPDTDALLSFAAHEVHAALEGDADEVQLRALLERHLKTPAVAFAAYEVRLRYEERHERRPAAG